MLRKFYKFILVNNTNVTMTFDDGAVLNLKVTPIYTNPTTGKAVYGTVSEKDFSFTAGNTIVDGANVLTSEYDNSSDLFTGALVQLEANHDLAATATGSLDLYLSSGVVTSELEDDADGYVDPETNGLRIVSRMQWPAGLTNDDMDRGPEVEI